MKNNHLLRIIVGISFIGILWACSSSQPVGDESDEAKRMETRAKAVEIIRDDFGVPHIYAQTDADAVFGLLYAQAEDDFKRIERNYIWAIGRLAEVKGEAALFSDLRARLYMTQDEAKMAYHSAPEWLKKLCIAFADGLNYYLKTHPEVRPDLISHFEPWMPMYFFEGSIGGDIEQIPLDGIKAFYGEKRDAPRVIKPAFKEPSGSNGFAIAGKLTESGNPMLLINPHTSFYFRGEVHVVSEQGLNAYGAVTWGQFFVYQGFNENNGWMHTSTYADFKDEFVEDVFEKEGKLYYQYGEEKREMSVFEVTLKYRDGDSLREKTFPLYRTHHGPITHMQDGKWVATKINWKPVKALSQSYLRMKTTNHQEFRKMMDTRTNSSNNTVYADNSGNIAYYHGNFMPKRDSRFDYAQAVDGSDPATDWQGLHNIDDMITLLNPENGWLQNCNSTPFTSASTQSPKPENYPAYMAPDPENFRGLHAVRVLTGRKDLTLEKLIELAYDPYLPGLEALIPGLIAAFDNSKVKTPEISSAIDLLRHWNYQVSTDSIAMSLAHFYGMNYLNKRSYPAGLSFMERVEYLGRQSPESERVEVFTETIAQLTADFGQWNTPWGEINRFQRITGEIQSDFDDNQPSLPVGMASGRWGALASFGAVRDDDTKRLYGVSGNSFVAVVEFGEKVKAKSLLAGGQSGDPASPHFFDQAHRYIDRNFKTVAYYRDDVEKRAVSRYQPGKSLP